jgi:hypothetical protein
VHESEQQRIAVTEELKALVLEQAKERKEIDIRSERDKVAIF